jgi:large subunit ribosomal protein L24
MDTTAYKKPKLHIKKGDTVKVLSGKDRGKQGRVLEIVFKRDTRSQSYISKAIVEGVNMATKHRRPDSKNPQGAIVEVEVPLHVSKLALVVGGKTTRTGRKQTENGWVRYSKKTGEIIK